MLEKLISVFLCTCHLISGQGIVMVAPVTKLGYLTKMRMFQCGSCRDQSTSCDVKKVFLKRPTCLGFVLGHSLRILPW